MSNNSEIEEIIYYRLLELEQRLELKQEALDKTVVSIQELMIKAESILNTINKEEKRG